MVTDKRERETEREKEGERERLMGWLFIIIQFKWYSLAIPVMTACISNNAWLILIVESSKAHQLKIFLFLCSHSWSQEKKSPHSKLFHLIIEIKYYKFKDM